MKAYILYKDKSVKGFKKLVNSGNSIFDKYRSLAVSFIRYAGSDLDVNLSTYDKILGGIDNIKLENVFPTKYKWLVSDVSLKNSREYLKSLEDRITEFEGKEDNLKLVVGVLFTKFVLITQIVETYLLALSEMKSNNTSTDISKIDLTYIGIGKNVLKYFDVLADLSSKTLDDWLNYKADPATCKYFYSSMKRILSILSGSASAY